MEELKIEFKPFIGEKEILSLADAKTKLKGIMPGADLDKFEENIQKYSLLGYNDNFFKRLAK